MVSVPGVYLIGRASEISMTARFVCRLRPHGMLGVGARMRARGVLLASFLLGVSLELGRPIIVIECAGDRVLNPARIYGARNANGQLRHSLAKPNAPATVPSWFLMPFEEVITMLPAPTNLIPAPIRP